MTLCLFIFAALVACGAVGLACFCAGWDAGYRAAERTADLREAFELADEEDELNRMRYERAWAEKN